MDKAKPGIADPSRDLPDKLCLGVITSVHGVRGDIVVKSYTADPADIAAYGPLYDPSRDRSFDVKFVRLSKKGVVLRVKGVSDRNSAQALRGTELYIDRALLPELIDEDEWYISDLIGLDVYLFSSQEAPAPSGGQEKFGVIRGVQNYGAGDLLEIEPFAMNERGEGPNTHSKSDHAKDTHSKGAHSKDTHSKDICAQDAQDADVKQGAQAKKTSASGAGRTIFIPFLSEYVPVVSLPLRRVEIILPVEDDSLDPNRLSEMAGSDQAHSDQANSDQANSDKADPEHEA